MIRIRKAVLVVILLVASAFIYKVKAEALTVEINTKEDFLRVFNAEHTLSAAPNLQYLLEGKINLNTDININADELLSKYDRNLEAGKIIGNGHTLTITGDMKKELFKNINTASEIRDLNIVYNGNVYGSTLGYKIFSSTTTYSIVEDVNITVNGNIVPNVMDDKFATIGGVINNVAETRFTNVRLTVNGSLGDDKEYQYINYGGFSGYTTDGSPSNLPNVIINGCEVNIRDIKAKASKKMELAGLSPDFLYGSVTDTKVKINGIIDATSTAEEPLRGYKISGFLGSAIANNSPGVKGNTVKINEISFTDKNNKTTSFIAGFSQESRSSDNSVDISKISTNSNIAYIIGYSTFDEGSNNNHVELGDVDVSSANGSLYGYSYSTHAYDGEAMPSKNISFKAKKNSSILAKVENRFDVVGLYGVNSKNDISNSEVVFENIDIQSKNKAMVIGGVYSSSYKKYINSKVLFNGAVNITAPSQGVFAGYILSGMKVDIKDAFVQIARDIEVKGDSDEIVTGFAYKLITPKVENSTVLAFGKLLAPNSNFASGFLAIGKGGSIKNSASYVAKEISGNNGFLIRFIDETPIVIENTTVLKSANSNTAFANLSEGIGDTNSIVYVENGKRTGYRLVQLEGKYDKGERLGEAVIARRAFQNEIWGNSSSRDSEGYPLVAPYLINFSKTFNFYGPDGVISSDAKNISLENYEFRHQALMGGDNVTYDIVGIEGRTSFKMEYITTENGVETVDVDEMLYEVGSDIIVSEKKKDIIGFEFVGWTTDKNANGRIYKPGDIFKSTDINRLYAQYKPVRTYDIHFEANGGVGTMNDLTGLQEGDSVKLSANVFTREGYRFTGWSEVADAATIYLDGADFLVSKANVILYANWIKEASMTVGISYKGSDKAETIYLQLMGKDGFVKDLVFNGEKIIIKNLKTQEYSMKLSSMLEGYRVDIKKEQNDNYIEFVVDFTKAEKLFPSTGVGVNPIMILLVALLIGSSVSVIFIIKKLKRK